VPNVKKVNELKKQTFTFLKIKVLIEAENQKLFVLIGFKIMLI